MAAEPARPFVLITNGEMRHRSGTEVATRDYAIGLARRGWRVALYTNLVRPAVADELQGHVELICDLAGLEGTPDVIHGQHHPAIVPALARFPNVPAIQVCHDARIWFDEALLMDQVRRRAGVDDLCRERVAREAGVPLASVAFLPNAVDLARCAPRGPLPPRAGRVLILANHSDDHVAAALAACEQAGLAASVLGKAVGRESFDLEARMAEADIVVGAARIALEAMAVGCAVLVCDHRGLAGMAASADFDAWRRANFGRALLTQAVNTETLAAALAAYDAEDAASLSRRARETCGLAPALDRLEAFYREAIEAHRAAGPVPPARHATQLAAYLQRFLTIDHWMSPWGADHQKVIDSRDLLAARLAWLVGEMAGLGYKVAFDSDPPA